MVDLGSLLQQLKGWTPLATVFGLILIGSYKNVWVWGRQITEMKAEFALVKADFEARLRKQEESNERLWALVLQATGLAEAATVVAKRKVPPHDVP